MGLKADWREVECSSHFHRGTGARQNLTEGGRGPLGVPPWRLPVVWSLVSNGGPSQLSERLNFLD